MKIVLEIKLRQDWNGQGRLSRQYQRQFEAIEYPGQCIPPLTAGPRPSVKLLWHFLFETEPNETSTPSYLRFPRQETHKRSVTMKRYKVRRST